MIYKKNTPVSALGASTFHPGAIVLQDDINCIQGSHNLCRPTYQAKPALPALLPGHLLTLHLLFPCLISSHTIFEPASIPPMPSFLMRRWLGNPTFLKHVILISCLNLNLFPLTELHQVWQQQTIGCQWEGNLAVLCKYFIKIQILSVKRITLQVRTRCLRLIKTTPREEE